MQGNGSHRDSHSTRASVLELTPKRKLHAFKVFFRLRFSERAGQLLSDMGVPRSECSPFKHNKEQKLGPPLKPCSSPAFGVPISILHPRNRGCPWEASVLRGVSALFLVAELTPPRDWTH